MFREVLQNAVDSTEGGVGGLLMGFDGIAVDQYVRDGSAFDVQTIGMEYSVILKQIQTAAEMLDADAAFHPWGKPHGYAEPVGADEEIYRFVASFATTEEHVDKLDALL